MLVLVELMIPLTPPCSILLQTCHTTPLRDTATAILIDSRSLWGGGLSTQFSPLSASISHGARKLRKITSVAAVRAAEAQGVVTYMQVGSPKTVGNNRKSMEILNGRCLALLVLLIFG